MHREPHSTHQVQTGMDEQLAEDCAQMENKNGEHRAMQTTPNQPETDGAPPGTTRRSISTPASPEEPDPMRGGQPIPTISKQQGPWRPSPPLPYQPPLPQTRLKEIDDFRRFLDPQIPQNTQGRPDPEMPLSSNPPPPTTQIINTKQEWLPLTMHRHYEQLQTAAFAAGLHETRPITPTAPWMAPSPRPEPIAWPRPQTPMRDQQLQAERLGGTCLLTNPFPVPHPKPTSLPPGGFPPMPTPPWLLPMARTHPYVIQGRVIGIHPMPPLETPATPMGPRTAAQSNVPYRTTSPPPTILPSKVSFPPHRPASMHTDNNCIQQHSLLQSLPTHNPKVARHLEKQSQDASLRPYHTRNRSRTPFQQRREGGDGGNHHPPFLTPQRVTAKDTQKKWRDLPFHMKVFGPPPHPQGPSPSIDSSSIHRSPAPQTEPPTGPENPTPGNTQEISRRPTNVYSNYNLEKPQPSCLLNQAEEPTGGSEEREAPAGGKGTENTSADTAQLESGQTAVPSIPPDPPSDSTPQERRARLQMIPNPLRSAIAESPFAPLIPESWFNIFPIGWYKERSRTFSNTLQMSGETLLRAFIAADINLMARDLRLSLLLFRGFTRAKYGMRSEAIAHLLGVESTAQLLMTLQNRVRLTPRLQAYTLPTPLVDRDPSIPIITSHYIPDHWKRLFPTSDHLFHQVQGIYPIMSDGTSIVTPRSAPPNRPEMQETVTPSHQDHLKPTGLQQEVREIRSELQQKTLHSYMRIQPHHPAPTSTPPITPDKAATPIFTETTPILSIGSRTPSPTSKTPQTGPSEQSRAQALPHVPQTICEGRTQSSPHASLPATTSNRTTSNEPQPSEGRTSKKMTETNILPELTEEETKNRRDQISRVLQRLKATPNWETRRRAIPPRTTGRPFAKQNQPTAPQSTQHRELSPTNYQKVDADDNADLPADLHEHKDNDNEPLHPTQEETTDRQLGKSTVLEAPSDTQKPTTSTPLVQAEPLRKRPRPNDPLLEKPAHLKPTAPSVAQEQQEQEEAFMPLGEIVKKARFQEQMRSHETDSLLQYTMRARRNDMSLEEKHYVGTLISDRSGYCRHDYVAPNANFIYRCPIPNCPNPRGRGGFPINSNGLYRKFKAHLEQHHKNIPRGVEITTVSREGNSRVYTYPRPSAHPPRKRYGIAESAAGLKPTTVKSDSLPAYPHTGTPKAANTTPSTNTLHSQTQVHPAERVPPLEIHETVGESTVPHAEIQSSAPCLDEEQISLALSDETSHGTNNQKKKSSNDGCTTNSPLPLRLKDFESPSPMPLSSGIPYHTASRQPESPISPKFSPPKPPRKKKGILHDVQLDPFEYIESMARHEVRLTQPDSPERNLHSLLPDYSSQDMQYTQPIPDQNMRALLPTYATQDSEEGSTGKGGGTAPDTQTTECPPGGNSVFHTKPPAQPEPEEADQGERITEPKDQIEGSLELAQSHDKDEETPQTRRPTSADWPSPNAGPSTERKKEEKMLEIHTLLTELDAHPTTGPPLQQATDVVDLHEFFLAAPLTRTGQRVEYEAASSKPADPRTSDQRMPTGTTGEGGGKQTALERKDAKLPGKNNLLHFLSQKETLEEITHQHTHFTYPPSPYATAVMGSWKNNPSRPLCLQGDLLRPPLQPTACLVQNKKRERLGFFFKRPIVFVCLERPDFATSKWPSERHPQN